MLVGQALGEYGMVSALGQAVREGGVYIEELGREWGLTGLVVAVAVGVLWKLITRVR